MIFTALYVLLHTLRNKNISLSIPVATYIQLPVHAADSHAYSFNLDPLADCQHCTNPVTNITKSTKRLMPTPLSCYEVLSANFATYKT
jgi:hypothetical protein